MTDEELEKLARKEGAKASSELSDIELEMMAREEGAKKLIADEEALHKYKGYIDTGIGATQKAISVLDKPRSIVMAPVIQGGKALFEGDDAMAQSGKALLDEAKTIYPTNKGSFQSLTDSKSSKTAKALAIAADVGAGLATGKAVGYMASKLGSKFAKHVLKMKSLSPEMEGMKESGVFDDAAKHYYENPSMNSVSNEKVLDNITGTLKETTDPIAMTNKIRRDRSSGLMGKNVSEQSQTIANVGDEVAAGKRDLVMEAEDLNQSQYTDHTNQLDINDMRASNKQARGIVQSKTIDDFERIVSDMENESSQLRSLRKDFAVKHGGDIPSHLPKDIAERSKMLKKIDLKLERIKSLGSEMKNLDPEDVNISELYSMRKAANKHVSDLSSKTELEASRSQKVYRNLKNMYDERFDTAIKKTLSPKEYQAFKQRDKDISSMMNIQELLSGSRSKKPNINLPYGTSPLPVSRSLISVSKEIPGTVLMKAARANDANINRMLNPFGLSGLQLMGSSANIPLQLANFRVPRDIDSIIANKDSVLAKIAQETNDLKVVDSVRDAIEKTPSKLETILPAIIMQFPNVFEEDRYGRINNKVPPEMRNKATLDIWNNTNLSNTEKAAKVKMVNGNGYLED